MPQDMVEIKKAKDTLNTVCCSDGDYYPYGTSLELRNEMIEDMGVEALSVGDIVEVRGFAFVERKSEHQDGDGSEKNMSLQLTQLKVRREESDRAETLYGGK